ncbi:hypothetical protein RND81_09G078100 [Saponaria officinalis]|uniref:Zinc finger PHD-type domain-containing protein n=1 Tax=Saponaria officinalis TaxID=3572 RepID=A0AAW1IJY4_SAPOF
MSLPILQACKKRKIAPKLYSMKTFCDPGCPIQPIGAFRDNIRLFLRECAVVEDYCIESMAVWCTLLVQDNRGIVIPLYTIEENVKFSDQPFCDHCRCSGWNHHYMCKRKYHVIIPLDCEWNKPLDSDVFDIQTHLLHGVIHCNGFGHLLCINGFDGGSKYIRGREIMDLWDRICTNLHARKITIEDTSKKRSMELRLLHGIAYGRPWFGRWGYKFSHGCFGVQAHHYQRAVEILSSLDFDDLVLSMPKENPEVQRIISSYRQKSETRLITLRDLLKFMLSQKSNTPANTKTGLLTLKSKSSACPKNSLVNLKPLATVIPKTGFFPVSSRGSVLQRRPLSIKGKPTKLRKFTSVVATMDTRWPKRRLEYTAGIIVDALKEHKEISKFTKSGMTRQEVRDAARAHIGDTGLLDYVLKSMNNVIVGDYIVRRHTNTANKVLEYTIQKLGEIPRKVIDTECSSVHVLRLTGPASVPQSDVLQDLYILYKDILLEQLDSDISGLSVRAILDSKHLVKEWPFNDETDQLLRFICRILPTSYELDMELSRELSPGELIVLPLHATFGDLKVAAEHALRDTYCIMEYYVVNDIECLDSLMDDEVVFGSIESGSGLWVRGSGIDLKSELRYEAGPDNWTVKCSCGATDDDGERMVSCDICEVWQHTRCSGIDDSEGVPPLFVCQMCCSSLMPPRAETSFLQGSLDLIIQPAFEETWGAIHS